MNKEVKNIITLSICVIFILAVAYLSTAVFVTEEFGNKKDNQTTTKSITNYDNSIIAGKVFNQKDEEYMVILFSDKDSKDKLKEAINSYSKITKLYVVNTDLAINKYVVSKEENSIPKSSSELKVKDYALITISNGEVISYVSDLDSIIEALK